MIALPADFLEDNTSEFLGSVLCFWCRHNQDSMKKNLPRDVMLRFRPRSPIETLNLYLTKLAGPTPYTYTSCSCSLSLWAFQCSVGRCHCGGRIINILACASSKKRKKRRRKKSIHIMYCLSVRQSFYEHFLGALPCPRYSNFSLLIRTLWLSCSHL